MNRLQPLRNIINDRLSKHRGERLGENGESQLQFDRTPVLPYANSLFPYRPLNPSVPGYFRLVRLEPMWSSLNDLKPSVSLFGSKTPHCKLTNAVWSSKNTAYEALSYVWGDTTTTRTISLNNTPFVVTENLYTALMHLRYDNVSRLMWIDAICIDQNNVEERNHQVESMGQIYANCKKVVIWLGEKDGESDATLDFIDLMSGKICRSWYSMPGIWAVWDYSLSTSLLTELFNSSTASQWMAVCRLLGRPWWRRAWVFQEFVRAPAATFYVGSARLSWKKIYYMIKIMYSAPDMMTLLKTEISDPAGTLTDANDMIYARLRNERRRTVTARAALTTSLKPTRPITSLAVTPKQIEQTQFSFFDYLWHYHHSRALRSNSRNKGSAVLNMADTGVTCALSRTWQKSLQWKSDLASITPCEGIPEANSALAATVQTRIERTEFSYFAYLLQCQRSRSCGDPRDKVYSILSMADAEITAALSPNYSESVRWTYILAVKVHIRVYLNLDILCYSMHGTTALDYPSWCPDWEKSQNRSVLGISLLSMRYDACGGRNAHAKPSRDDSVLGLKGVRIDTVWDACIQSSTQGFSWKSTPGGLRCSWDVGGMAAQVKAAKKRLPMQEFDSSSSEGLDTTKADGDDKFLYEQLTSTLVAGYYTTNSSSTLDPPPLFQDRLTREWWPEDRLEFCRQTYQRSWGRTVVLTEYGHLGLAPQETMTGDEIFILYGCSTPVVLRRDEGQRGLYVWVGDVYIHGAMQGEAVNDMEGGWFGEEMVLIR